MRSRCILAALLLLGSPLHAQRAVIPSVGGGQAQAGAAAAAAAPTPVPLEIKLSAPLSPVETVPAADPSLLIPAGSVSVAGPKLLGSAPLAQAGSLALARSAIPATGAQGGQRRAAPAAPGWTVDGTAQTLRGKAPVSTRGALDGIAERVRSIQEQPKDSLDKGFDGTAPAAGSALSPAESGGAAGDRAPLAKSYDYARMLDLTRRLLTRPAVRAFLRDVFREDLAVTPEMRKRYKLPSKFEKVKEVSESQFMHLLQHSPELHDRLDEFLAEVEGMREDTKKYEKASEKWTSEFRARLKDPELRERFRVLNDPLRAFRLVNADGSAGYSNARVFVNHASVVDGRELPPADLKRVAIDFIHGAKKELLLNVFDFDLLEVADALVERAKAGVKVTVGIDKGVAEARPEVKAVIERLKTGPGLTVVLVDSVALNHQKLIVSDPDDPESARSLLSSGNLTQSCVGPEGDLVHVAERPDYSKPNANHMVTVDGYLPAQVIAHSLRKTLEYGLRGDEYPLGGAFKVLGAKPADGSEAPFLLLTFSPKGALGDINRDITRRVLLETRGTVRGMYFAASSEEFETALALRAKAEVDEGRDPDVRLVGDGSMAVRDWSSLLWLSGWRLEVGEKGGKRYVKEPRPALMRLLGAKAFEKVRAAIRVAPQPYRVHRFTTADGASAEVNAKLHHKVLISGGLAVMGTSFNFSENANKNQEQFLLTNDPRLVAGITGAFDAMYARSRTSVSDEATRRNAFWASGGDKDDLTVGNQYRHVDEQGKRERRARRRTPRAQTKG